MKALFCLMLKSEMEFDLYQKGGKLDFESLPMVKTLHQNDAKRRNSSNRRRIFIPVKFLTDGIVKHSTLNGSLKRFSHKGCDLVRSSFMHACKTASLYPAGYKTFGRATDKARKSVFTHWKSWKTHWKNIQGVKIRISISLYTLGI